MYMYVWGAGGTEREWGRNRIHETTHAEWEGRIEGSQTLKLHRRGIKKLNRKRS